MDCQFRPRKVRQICRLQFSGGANIDPENCVRFSDVSVLPVKMGRPLCKLRHLTQYA